MTNAMAKAVLDDLSPNAIVALKVMRRIIPAFSVTLEAIQELVDKGLGRHDINLLDNDKKIFVLTYNGRRVADQLKEKH